MKKIIVGMLMIVGLGGCVFPTNQERAQWIEYTQDDRTHLCFATYKYDRSMSFSNVPCTSEVLEQIRFSRVETERLRGTRNQ